MTPTQKKIIKQLSTSINMNSKAKNIENILIIESLIKEILFAEEVRFYKYNREDDSIIHLGTDVSMAVEDSLLEKSIRTTKIQFDNHIVSNRYYNPSLDNPKELLIRSLLVYPIVKHKKTIALLAISRSKKQNKNFTRHDEILLKEIEFFLVKFLEGEIIEENELLEIVGIEEIEDEEKKPITKKPITKKVVKKEPKVVESISPTILKKLQKDLDISLQSEAQLKEKYQSEIDTFGRIEAKYKSDEEKLQEKIRILESQEADNRLLKEENHLFLNEIERLKEEVSCLNIDIEEFKIATSEKNKAIQMYQNMEIKEKIRQTKIVHKFDDMESNLEFLLKIMGKEFKEFDNAYSMFELFIYSLSSSKGMEIIEKHLSDNKIFIAMIEEFYEQRNIIVHLEKYELAKLFDSLNSYVEQLSNNKIKLEIIADAKLPKTLVIDTPKVCSILHHLISNILGFSQNSDTVRFEINYENKALEFKLGVNTERTDTNIFKNIFGSSKTNNKSKIEIIITKKLLQSLGGNLNLIHTEKLYQYQLKIPAKVLDLKFI